MEWTAGLEFPARFLELDATPDDLDNVCPGDQIIDEFLGNQSGPKSSNVEPAPPGLWQWLRSLNCSVKGR